MCRMGRVNFSGCCEGLVIKFCFFSLLSCIFGCREKRTEHISFLAFQTNFLKQVHCDNKKYLKKMISDVVTLGTFCYRDQSFINRRGSVISFTEREVLNLTPPPTHTHKTSRKNSDPPLTKHFKTSNPPPRPPYTQTTSTYDNPISLSGPAEY